MNLFYDLTSACTSIVAQTHNGSIIHGRNLDYSLPNLQNITLKVNFTSRGQLVYQYVLDTCN
jgi:N-acylethanolamine-hydrolysing acid amidase